MAGNQQLFDPGAGYIVTASYQWPAFSEEVFELLYQPVLGPTAFAMFHALKTQLRSYPVISDRQLQSQLLIQLNAGCQAAEEALRRLEAIGMLRTFEQSDQLGKVFVYELQATVTPVEFINDNLLSVLLLEAVGEKRFGTLSRYANRFSLGEAQASLHEITHNFFEAFHIDEEGITHLPTEVSDARQAIVEERPQDTSVNSSNFDWPTLIQLLGNQPITKDDLENNRELIEVEHQLYGIDEPTMARLLPQATDLVTNKLQPQKLKQLIASTYRVDASKPDQQKQVEDASTTAIDLSSSEQQLLETCNYYAPVTFLQQLKQQMGGFVTSGERTIIRRLIEEQKMNPGVVNILSWYVIASLGRATLQANYVNAIANNWLRAGVSTAKEALTHIHQFNDQKGQKHSSGRRSSTYRRQKATTVREKMPAWSKKDEHQAKKSSPEQLKKLRERLAKRKQNERDEGK